MLLDSLDPTFTQDVPCLKEFFVLDMIILHALCLFRLFYLSFFFQFLHEVTTKISNQRRNRGPTLALNVQL